MNITHLPFEIWTIIINYLDIKSKVNLYNSSKTVRSFFVANHVKRISLSRSTLASIYSLKQDLFIDHAKYIVELNLSGIHSITAEAFQPYVQTFENLITLDVTFTNIYLSDLKIICTKNLKNIGINFFKCASGCYKLREQWNNAKQVFIEHNFTYVHFIVFDFHDSRLPLVFLNNLPLIEHIEVDIVDNEKFCGRRYSYDGTEEVANMNFSRLRYLFRDCVFMSQNTGNIKDLLKIDFDEVEYIFLMYSKNILIYVSPMFQHLFSMNSIAKVKVEKSLPNYLVLEGNAIFHAWHKSTTNFDEKLFGKILEDCKDYFPVYVCMHNILTTNILSSHTKWYCLDKFGSLEMTPQDTIEKLTLTNYCRINNVKKSITCSRFDEWNQIKNITFLRIGNLTFGDEFFLNLFTNCKKIETLDLYFYNPRNNFPDYISPLSKSMDQASSLKNIKLTLEYTEYDFLFEALSKCRSLKNIHICDFVRSFDYIDVNPAKIYALLENCKELYSLFIEADTSPQISTILYSSIYEVMQRLELFHLFVDVNTLFYAWNPFVDVFNPSPLQIVD